MGLASEESERVDTSSGKMRMIRWMCGVKVIDRFVCILTERDRLGQLSLLPSEGREMSTIQSAVTLCGWGVKAGMVHSTCG